MMNKVVRSYCSRFLLAYELPSRPTVRIKRKHQGVPSVTLAACSPAAEAASFVTMTSRDYVTRPRALAFDAETSAETRSYRRVLRCFK